MKKNTVTILTIDPGLTNTGWAVMECDVVSGVATITKHGEFHPGPTAEKALYREETEKFSKRTISLKLLRENLEKIMVECRPDYVTIEDIFFNPTRPMAHAALAMWHCVARIVALDVLGKPVEIIQTKIAKQVVTGSGANGKLSVQQAVLSLKGIRFKSKALELTMSEHIADAIAVGYAFFEKNHNRILSDAGLVKYSEGKK